jgi:PAS domain S-box-containing protein
METELSRQLSVAQNTLDTMIRCSPTPTVLIDKNGIITCFNPAAEALLGYAAKDMIGNRTPGFFHDMDEVIDRARERGWQGDVTKVTFEELLPYFQMGETHSEKWHMITRSGERVPVLLGLSLFRDKDQNVFGYLGMITDLRDQKAVEKQLQYRLSRLDTIATQLPGYIYEYVMFADGTSCFPYTSAGIEQLHGVTPERAARDVSWMSEVTHPDDWALVNASIEETVKNLTEWNCDFRVIRKDGSIRWVSGSATPTRLADGSIVWHGYIGDCTARHEAEAALERKSALLQLLTETALDFIDVPVTQADAAIQKALESIGKFFSVDRAYLFRYNANGETASNTHEWCAEGIEPFIEQLQDVPMQSYFEWYERHCAGEVIQIDDVAAMSEYAGRELLLSQGIQSIISVPLLRDGKPIGFIGFDAVSSKRHFSEDKIPLLKIFARALVSVRSRVESHRALAESQAELEVFFDVALDYLCICSLEGRFLRVNHAWEVFLGLPQAEIVGREFMEFVHPEDRAVTLQALHDFDSKKRVDGFVNRYLDCNGRWRDLSWVSILHNGKIYSTARDVTAEREATSMLAKSLQDARGIAKTRSRLISMASHEFRTPLASIRLSGEMVQRQLQKQDPEVAQLVAKHLERIIVSSDRLTEMVTNVLELDGKRFRGDGNLVKINVGSFCEDCLDAFKDTHACAHRVVCTIESDSAQTWIKESLLHSALDNLLENAVKYSAAGSLIEVCVDSDADHVFIEVKDQGMGINQYDRKYLFEPFFRSNHARGISGTGLGLAIVSKSIERMGGIVNYRPNKPKGSVFSISLPLADH